MQSSRKSYMRLDLWFLYFFISHENGILRNDQQKKKRHALLYFSSDMIKYIWWSDTTKSISLDIKNHGICTKSVKQDFKRIRFEWKSNPIQGLNQTFSDTLNFFYICNMF